MRDDATRIQDALEAIERIEKYAARGRPIFDEDELNEYLRPWTATPGQALDFVDCGRPQRSITAVQPFGLRGSMNRKSQQRSKLRGMNPIAIQTWVVYHLQILAEALLRMEESTRSSQNAIPWDEIRGMRNILIHEYFGIDKDIVWAVVESDLPKLRTQLEELSQQL